MTSRPCAEKEVRGHSKELEATFMSCLSYVWSKNQRKIFDKEVNSHTFDLCTYLVDILLALLAGSNTTYFLQAIFCSK